MLTDCVMDMQKIFEGKAQRRSYEKEKFVKINVELTMKKKTSVRSRGTLGQFAASDCLTSEGVPDLCT